MAKKLELSDKRRSGLETKHGKQVIEAISDVFQAMEDERADKEALDKQMNDILDKTNSL
ncbi:hypothetical protein [Dysgonomonas macrotermitis]|uniref:Uncharacterized protein n=1 Tax=Dysgonomonas macrotermitis TaxID=1346286 RepID=A0A1M5GM14_9BACT|nr:hypothetical protein [Dysgonomonas macrotermitis]SHG04747.1 hypothetical protein SAMN05444362_11460 [Dysgonomonas macrotermitis]